MARFGAAGAKAILLLGFAAHCHLARAECGESEVCENEMAAPSGGDALLAKRMMKLGATVATEEAEAEQQHGQAEQEAAKAAGLERRRKRSFQGRTQSTTETPQSTWLTMPDMDYRKSGAATSIQKAFDHREDTFANFPVFVVDLGTSYVISKIKAVWRWCHKCQEAGILVFSVSEDGETWTPFHSPKTKDPYDYAKNVVGKVNENYNVEASGRYFRIETTNEDTSKSGLSFWELGFYGYLDPKPKQPNVYGWFHSYRAGENFLSGTEILHLTPYQGKLFGGTGYWKHTGKHRGAEIVRLDCEFCDWVIETPVGHWAGRVESLKAIEWTTDASGQAIAHGPISKLVAGWYMNSGGTAQCIYNVRVDDGQRWNAGVYWEKKPYKESYYSARAMELYQDPITKVDHLFATTGMDGIIAGVYCQECQTSVSFPDRTESGPVGTRPLAIAIHDGNIYFSASSYIKRRVNGYDAHWITVFDMADHSSATVDEAVGGIRGLTSIANAGSPTGRSMLFSWSPNEDSAGCMVRLDPTGDDNLGFVHKQEQCTRDVAKAYLGKNVAGQTAKVTFVISDYNNVLEVNDEKHGTVHLIGYEILLFDRSTNDYAIDPDQTRKLNSGKMISFYVGAGYMIRKGPNDYQAREPRGPRYNTLDVYPKLTAVRTISKSPWDDAIYMGGYDCNHYGSKNTAWVYRGEKAAVFAEDVPCQKELGCGHKPGAPFDESNIGCDFCKGREFLGHVAAYWNADGTTVSCQSLLDWVNTLDDEGCANAQKHDLARVCCGGCDFCLGTNKNFVGSEFAAKGATPYTCDAALEWTVGGGASCKDATGWWSKKCCKRPRK